MDIEQALEILDNYKTDFKLYKASNLLTAVEIVEDAAKKQLLQKPVKVEEEGKRITVCPICRSAALFPYCLGCGQRLL